MHVRVSSRRGGVARRGGGAVRQKSERGPEDGGVEQQGECQVHDEAIG